MDTLNFPSVLNYPTVKAYSLPKKNILVISCMDLRLTDNMVDFLNFDNLHNRYDHFILAGASLLCTKKNKHHFVEGKYEEYSSWKPNLIHHVEIAVDLHDIKDIYLFEHQDCGAYSKLLKPGAFDFSTYEKELAVHKQFAEELAEELNKMEWPKEDNKDGKKYRLGVHCFYIDLRGNVEFLSTYPIPKQPEAALGTEVPAEKTKAT